MVEIKRCEYCGALSSENHIKDIAYGLFAQYENICENCYDEMEIKASMDKTESITV